MKLLVMSAVVMAATSVQAQQFCYNPSNALDSKNSKAVTSQFESLIEDANDTKQVSCVAINNDEELKDAEKLISETPTENTFWIE